MAFGDNRMEGTVEQINHDVMKQNIFKRWVLVDSSCNQMLTQQLHTFKCTSQS